jgi:glyoxylase-like metal-dependent hydrolase (beta-lactamase superfamily II)
MTVTPADPRPPARFRSPSPAHPRPPARFRSPSPVLGRRVFIRQLGRATLGVVTMSTLAACATTGGQSAGGQAPAAGTAGTSPAPQSTGAAGDGPVDWHRVDLGFVSAFILVRGGEAAVVDTGVAGSVEDIERGLAAAGVDWGAVGHVILTHKHDDHVGSAAAVLERAADATPYAGQADIAAIDTPRPVTAVADDDRVFGLQIITTPGHTPGHIAVLDPAGGILVAGDALVGAGGGVDGPDRRFTEDMPTAHESVRKLAGFTFGTALFGHGDPVEGGADAAVAALADRL